MKNIKVNLKEEKLVHLNRIVLPVLWLLVVVTIGFSFSCGSDDEEIVIFAAASLTDVLDEVKKRYESEHAASVEYNFGGSQALAVELSKGSPGDVFISAGNPPMQFLTQESDIEISGISVIAYNSLIVVTKAQDIELPSHFSLLDLDLIAIADPNLAPAGFYSQQFLMNTGMWTDLQDKLIFAADVRAALNYVKSGNVDAAIVYMTDGMTEPHLQIRDIVPLDSYSNISYPAVVVGNENSSLSNGFVDFLLSSEVEQLFYSYGFR